MPPQIPWELVADPLGSAGHILGTTTPRHKHHQTTRKFPLNEDDKNVYRCVSAMEY